MHGSPCYHEDYLPSRGADSKQVNEQTNRKITLLDVLEDKQFEALEHGWLGGVLENVVGICADKASWCWNRALGCSGVRGGDFFLI